MLLSETDITHIFERLREGTVPERGLKAFAVGIESPMEELKRNLSLVKNNEGGAKFLRGGYGCGKTFISQLAMLEALEQNFAVSKVVVSSNDTPLYKLDTFYSKIIENLQTPLSYRGALGDCIDRWIGKVEARLMDEGKDPDADDFDSHVRQRFEQDLVALSQEESGGDFIAVVREYFRLKQQGDIPSAMQLLAWVSGSKNIAASVKKGAGVKGEISSQTALTYLKGILHIIKKAGYSGFVVVVDEIETILRMRGDIREKSLNGIRQILDATPEFKGLFWLFTGTPEFYDNKKGVAGLMPLHDRIGFSKSGGFVNIKQPQLELKPFDRQRLQDVALHLRELYPSLNKQRVIHEVSDPFITNLVDKITSGLGRQVGIIPRQFLREFVNILDLVDQHQDYHPSVVYEFTPQKLTPEESGAEQGNPEANDDIKEVEF
ncbi:BREX system ATP-binding protein BrxD [Deltaproteobacteria bacterium TL4]